MTYDEEIHQLVNEFILDILLKNCDWLLTSDDQQIIYAGTINDTLVEVKTVTRHNGFIRDYVIRHKLGVPERYGFQLLFGKHTDWSWLDIPEWRRK